MILLPAFYRDESFRSGILGLSGLALTKPMTEDFAPIYPWFGVVLVGIFIGNFYRTRRDRIAALANLGQAQWRPLTLLGEHSLVFYMLHQLVLFPLAWLVQFVIR
jgi:uncharacterized membrane protein